MIYIYPNTLSTFVGSRATALKSGYKEITEEVYADLVETKRKWQNGQIIVDTTYSLRKQQEAEEKQRQEQAQAIQDEINALKQNLARTDYKAIKYAEGLIPEEEYASIRQERQAWRDRINELETQE